MTLSANGDVASILDRRVYIPDDIRIGNVNEELVDFLEECNIRLRGAYSPIMI